MSKITRTSRSPRPSPSRPHPHLRSRSRRISVRAAVATAVLVGTMAIPTTTAIAAGPTGARADDAASASVGSPAKIKPKTRVVDIGAGHQEKQGKQEETVRRTDGLRTDVMLQTSSAGPVMADEQKRRCRIPDDQAHYGQRQAHQERHRTRAHHEKAHGAKAKKLHAGRRVTAVEQKPTAQIADDREERNGTHAALIAGRGGAAAAAVVGGGVLAIAHCGDQR
ncbi:hypothetical protein SSP35_05_03120 [Streptomyces sp. NBRC 110611]|uniref:hypothetical protein n=1 Tax=Streptomyces sp. NBRC 110611 TaxID=1621259 RepID=UPI00082E3F54|nr:hypothetical protein [Streptomyces sp. NBRC 110611]GAU67745.1 hypothetical protein SSP35_05_03120 [Streptomyces sp. NBRC 110611]